MPINAQSLKSVRTPLATISLTVGIQLQVLTSLVCLMMIFHMTTVAKSLFLSQSKWQTQKYSATFKISYDIYCVPPTKVLLHIREP